MARVLLLGCPYHRDTGVFLDRVVTDFDSITKFASKAPGVRGEDAESSLSQGGAQPRGWVLDGATVYDGQLTRRTALRRIRDFLVRSSKPAVGGARSPNHASTSSGTSADDPSSSGVVAQPLVIVFAGHGREGSGDWILADGDVSFDDVVTNLLFGEASEEEFLAEVAASARTAPRSGQAAASGAARGSSVSSAPRDVLLICDCCFSGAWVDRLSIGGAPSPSGRGSSPELGAQPYVRSLTLQSSCGASEPAFDGIFLSAWTLVHSQQMEREYAIRHFSHLGKHPRHATVSTSSSSGGAGGRPAVTGGGLAYGSFHLLGDGVGSCASTRGSFPGERRGVSSASGRDGSGGLGDLGAFSAFREDALLNRNSELSQDYPVSGAAASGAARSPEAHRGVGEESEPPGSATMAHYEEFDSLLDVAPALPPTWQSDHDRGDAAVGGLLSAAMEAPSAAGDPASAPMLGPGSSAACVDRARVDAARRADGNLAQARCPADVLHAISADPVAGPVAQLRLDIRYY